LIAGFYYLNYLVFGKKLLRTPFSLLEACLSYYITHGIMLYVYDVWQVQSMIRWVLLIDTGAGIITGFIYTVGALRDSDKLTWRGKYSSSSCTYNSSYYDAVSSGSSKSSSSSYSDSSFGGGDFGGGGASGSW
jgi:uncharacterized membrane protein YgcG